MGTQKLLGGLTQKKFQTDFLTIGDTWDRIIFEEIDKSKYSKMKSCTDLKIPG